MKEIKFDELRTIQMDILQNVHEFCLKHHIRYSLAYGTLLGAVRHGGYIPWDDDIDIGFTRENYEKFLAVADKEYPGKYRTLNPEVDPNYVLMTSRWIKCGTCFQEECFKDSSCDFGIFLDLFCFENIPDDEKAMKKQAFTAWFWGKLLVMRGVAHPTIYAQGISKIILQSIAWCGHWGMKILHISPSFLYRQAKKAAVKYKDVETKRVAYLFDPSLYTSIVEKKYISPTKKMPYEDMMIQFPGKVEAYLETRYGSDYMTLPPEEKRHNHPPYRLDFGEEIKTK